MDVHLPQGRVEYNNVSSYWEDYRKVKKHKRCNSLCQIDYIVVNISQNWSAPQKLNTRAESPSLAAFPVL